MRTRVLLAAGILLAVLGGWLLLRPGSRLPAAARGAIVFVSDRDGVPALYWRRLPKRACRRLTFGSEAVEDPAVSPDGTRVAFAMGGRIGVVAVASGEVSILTLGVDWQDTQPAWLPDARRLVVSARRREGDPAGLQLLELRPDGTVERHPLTQPRVGADTSPAPSPGGASIVFVREEHLMSVDLADGRLRRLTGGFKRERSPRFLPTGRIVCAWSEGKRHGIDEIDPLGRSRRTIVEGGRYYRTLAPSPDGRFLVATLGYDAGFRPMTALVGGQREQLDLLDAQGRELAVLEASSRHANRSADWGP